MQCLYCKKRLGLFASKKRQFCSELHEVAYHDEQSGLAMRRVLDPLFTAAAKTPQVRTAPTPPPPSQPVEAEPESRPALKAAPVLEVPAPAQGGFCLRQQLPKPAAPDLAAA